MLYIDQETLAATYELLKVTAPFHRWKLPASSEIRFGITRSTTDRGECFIRNYVPYVRISDRLHRRLPLLLETMSHEMIHLYEDTQHPSRNDVKHSWRFRRYAKQVCDHHGFDLENFI